MEQVATRCFHSISGLRTSFGRNCADIDDRESEGNLRLVGFEEMARFLVERVMPHEMRSEGVEPLAFECGGSGAARDCPPVQGASRCAYDEVRREVWFQSFPYPDFPRGEHAAGGKDEGRGHEPRVTDRRTAHLAVERALLNPMETAANKKELFPIKELKLNVKALAIHIANQRKFVRRQPLKRKISFRP